MDNDEYAKQLAEQGLAPEEIAKIIEHANREFAELFGEDPTSVPQ